MSHLVDGFAAELVKTGGALKFLGKRLKGAGAFAMKHPYLTLGGVTVPLATAAAARAGYQQGRSGSKSRYLAAGRDKSGQIMPSEVAFKNYHQLFRHRPSAKEVRAPSRHYREKAFK